MSGILVCRESDHLFSKLTSSVGIIVVEFYQILNLLIGYFANHIMTHPIGLIVSTDATGNHKKNSILRVLVNLILMVEPASQFQ